MPDVSLNLSLTFRGPFLFVVPGCKDDGTPQDYVTIYAPQCEEHSGSVFWGDGSAPLYGRARLGGKLPYTLMGLNANDGKISYQWNAGISHDSPILGPEAAGSAERCATSTKLLWDAYFSIRVPRPLVYYALNLVRDTEVVQDGNCKNNFVWWGTGFRLYYQIDPNNFNQLKLYPPDLSAGLGPNPILIVPPTGKRQLDHDDWLPLPKVADVEFQFEASAGDDMEHRDATSCFGQITTLANLDWWLNFDNNPASGGAAVHSGADCGALPVVLGINN
jgi:hypothetical protein